MPIPDLDLPPRDGALTLIWPAAGNPVALLKFGDAAACRAFVNTLSFDPAIPVIVGLKYARAQNCAVSSIGNRHAIQSAPSLSRKFRPYEDRADAGYWAGYRRHPS